MLSVRKLTGWANFQLSTCPDEHDIILAVLCLHPVHHQLGELVVHIRPHHDGTPAYWVHWVVHGWVAPGEGDDVIREVLGGVEPPERLTGTLRMTFSNMNSSPMHRFCACKLASRLSRWTHSAWPRVRHPPLKRHPLVVGPISVGVGAEEDPPDVCHVVHAHR